MAMTMVLVKPSLFIYRRRLPYYEDFYGTQNADEAFDRYPDECGDTDTDNDEGKQQSLPSDLSGKSRDGLLSSIGQGSIPVCVAFVCCSVSVCNKTYRAALVTQLHITSLHLAHGCKIMRPSSVDACIH
jgi:hypothetical protein